MTGVVCGWCSEKCPDEGILRLHIIAKHSDKVRSSRMNTKSVFTSIALSGLVIFVVIELLISNGIILKPIPNEMQQKTGQQLQSLTNVIESKMHLKKPTETIKNGTIIWDFTDSKGNPYQWEIPMSTYDTIASQHLTFGAWYLRLPNGTIIKTYDYRPFIKKITASPEFIPVIDQLYNNAGSDYQFIYEVWYLNAEMTTYSLDMTNSNLWPIEVFTRGEGDCKDKAILIADMLRSSSHTANWQINLEIMDANNPSNPQTVNHMIVVVNTGQTTYTIDGTIPPTSNGINYWPDTIVGWQIPA